MADTAPRLNATDVGLHPARISLRGFSEHDLSAIVDIVAEALHEHYDSSLYFQLSQQWPEGFLTAVDEGGVPVGFLLGVVQMEREARILMFAVDRNHRGQGVGALLLQAFFDRCRRRRLARVTLEVRVSNATAIRFYSRFSFSVVDLLRGYYSDGENGYQMTRDVP